LPNPIRRGQNANIRQIIENGRNDGMTTMDQSLLARVKDGSIAAGEAYMKAADKNLFTSLLKPGELEAGGH
jgi:twitching motility protein PilT